MEETEPDGPVSWGATHVDVTPRGAELPSPSCWTRPCPARLRADWTLLAAQRASSTARRAADPCVRRRVGSAYLCEIPQVTADGDLSKRRSGAVLADPL